MTPILYSISEIENLNILNEFERGIDDIDTFLYKKAIDFEKRNISKTFLLINVEKIEIIGYFSLSIKSLQVPKQISKTLIKKINGINKDIDILNFFLIGQLAINNKYKGMQLNNYSIGQLLLSIAISKIRKAQKIIGLRYILVDAINHDKVIKFYEQNNFFIFINETETIKMIYKL
jgi:hypothetical protein